MYVNVISCDWGRACAYK